MGPGRRDARTTRLIRTFDRSAATYERGRPGYPADAVRFLGRTFHLGPGSTIVELGSGTGKFTRALLPLGAAVVAIEPMEGMRREFGRRVPTVPVLAGSAESIPLPDGFADAVFAAQSFHWFQGGTALREIARVLRPGGGLGLLWNEREKRDRVGAGIRHHPEPPRRARTRAARRRVAGRLPSADEPLPAAARPPVPPRAERAGRRLSRVGPIGRPDPGSASGPSPASGARGAHPPRDAPHDPGPLGDHAPVPDRSGTALPGEDPDGVRPRSRRTPRASGSACIGRPRGWRVRRTVEGGRPGARAARRARVGPRRAETRLRPSSGGSRTGAGPRSSPRAGDSRPRPGPGATEEAPRGASCDSSARPERGDRPSVVGPRRGVRPTRTVPTGEAAPGPDPRQPIRALRHGPRAVRPERRELPPPPPVPPR